MTQVSVYQSQSELGLLENRLTFLMKIQNYFSEKNNYIALQVY